MKSRVLTILSFSTVVLVFTACKKEEAPAPAPTPPPSAALPATPPAPPVPAAPAAVTNAAADAATAPAAPAAPADAEKVLSPTEAKDHVGEDATVKGKVFGVHTTAKGDTFINVGAAYPNAPFTVVHFHSDETITTNDLQALDGKTIAFSGKIKDHNGSAEIIIDKADQFKADDAAPDTATTTAPDAPKPVDASPAPAQPDAGTK